MIRGVLNAALANILSSTWSKNELLAVGDASILSEDLLTLGWGCLFLTMIVNRN